MKKRHYVLIILPVVVLVVILAIYLRRGPENPKPSEDVESAPNSGAFTRVDTATEDKTLSQLFEELGIVQIEPLAIPVDVTLPDLNGRQVRLPDFKGKVIFLNFWTTWCPPCREEMPAMEKLHRWLKHKAFIMVAIDMQEPASKVEAFFKEYKLTFMALLDSSGEVGLLFGIRSIPTTLILDKNGMIIGIAIGPRDWADKKSIALFEYLIDQEVELTS